MILGSLTVAGRPMADLGLDKAIIVHRDGHREPMTGLLVRPGQSINEAIKAAIPPGAYLILGEKS